MDLAELYARLPAAEEEDLLEQLAEERRRAAYERDASTWLVWPASVPRTGDLWSGEATEDDEEPPAEEPEPEPEEPLRLPVLLGLLEHQLGAVRLDAPTEP